MNDTRRHSGRPLTAVLLALVSCAAAATATDARLDSAWRNYLVNDTDVAPGYTFPYEHCFTRSANAHGVPQTL